MEIPSVLDKDCQAMTERSDFWPRSEIAAVFLRES